MKTIFEDWAHAWNISPQAVADLQRRAVMELTRPVTDAAGMLEGSVQKRIRLEAASKGVLLMRNNVGAYEPPGGGFVRYGLANDTASMNRFTKSADLIGIRPVHITPAHVGRVIGQFVARECKREGWKYKGTEKERAQLNFLQIILAKGGDACFAPGEGTI